MENLQRLKDAVDLKIKILTNPTSIVTLDEYNLWKDGQKIAAIKSYRLRTGQGLIESKNIFDLL